MSGPVVLAAGQIVFVDIPGQGEHPALVIHSLGSGGFVLVNGTGSPQDEDPIVVLSAGAAKACGLTKPTGFHCSKMFVWYWRPSVEPRVVGKMLPTYLADIRKAANATLLAMQSLPAEIGKLPEDCGGIALAHLKTLRAAIGPAESDEGAPPVSAP